MPIEKTIHPLDRLVFGVGTGDLTLADLARFTEDIVRERLMHYRKLIDATHCTPAFSEKELSAFVQVLNTIGTDRRRGALAIVVDPKRGEIAHIFAALGMNVRPVQVFRSLHEARKWLAGKPVLDE